MIGAASALKILLYGDFGWDRLATSYQRAFEDCGHRVIPFDIRTAPTVLAPWLRQRFSHRLTIRSLELRRAGTKAWNRHLLAASNDAHPDLVLILNGDFLMPETLDHLRAQGTRVFIFHADNPFPPHYANRPETLPCALSSDCYFVWSRSLVERLRQQGVKRVEYLPFAWDQTLFPYCGVATNPTNDVVFIGGWAPEREQFLTLLARDFNVKVWGPAYWNTRTRRASPLRRCWQGDAVYGAEAGRILASAGVALNILRRQNLPDGVIMRTFEVPGCGGCLLSTRTQGAIDLFPEGQAGAYFADAEECGRQIEQLLSQRQQRVQLAQAAHDIVRSAHRYTDRARQLLNVYQDLD